MAAGAGPPWPPRILRRKHCASRTPPDRACSYSAHAVELCLLDGRASLKAAVGAGGSVVVSFSDNNGLDWKEVARLTAAGTKRLDVTPLVLRRYDYRLKFELHGRGTGLEALRIRHDVQHSQRPLPALDKGVNTITFAAGPPEGTVTVEASNSLDHKGKQVIYTDFHPRMIGFEKNLFIGASGKGSITFPVATPGDMVQLRFGATTAPAMPGTDWISSCRSTTARVGRKWPGPRDRRWATANT